VTDERMTGRPGRGRPGADSPATDASVIGASAADVPRSRPFVVGVLSDTHGHLHPDVLKHLEGVDHIVHAGDIGTPEVLRALRRIAPVTAVRGNVDAGGWADALPSRAQVELAEACVVVGHVAPRRDGAGRPGQTVVVIAGHSHIAAAEWRDGVLYLNPGSAGPRRWGRPRTVARIEISAGRASPHIITVDGD